VKKNHNKDYIIYCKKIHQSSLYIFLLKKIKVEGPHVISNNNSKKIHRETINKTI